MAHINNTFFTKSELDLFSSHPHQTAVEVNLKFNKKNELDNRKF